MPLAPSLTIQDMFVISLHFAPFVRGSYSAKVPMSSLARVHREFVHHIAEDEVDGQEEGQDDKSEDGQQRDESAVIEESQNKHMSAWR